MDQTRGYSLYQLHQHLCNFEGKVLIFRPMTLFQKLLLTLATAFLAVMVYDRVNDYRHETAAQKVAKEKAMWNDYERCVGGLPYPGSTASNEAQQVWLRARQGCLANLGMPIQELDK
jgi:hypothetical protein